MISGVFYSGLGDAFDEAELSAYAPGSVVASPGDQPHFHWAKAGDYITQVTVLGPLGTFYIDPANDPRNNPQPQTGLPGRPPIRRSRARPLRTAPQSLVTRGGLLSRGPSATRARPASRRLARTTARRADTRCTAPPGGRAGRRADPPDPRGASREIRAFEPVDGRGADAEGRKRRERRRSIRAPNATPSPPSSSPRGTAYIMGAKVTPSARTSRAGPGDASG